MRCCNKRGGDYIVLNHCYKIELDRFRCMLEEVLSKFEKRKNVSSFEERSHFKVDKQSVVSRNDLNKCSLKEDVNW